MRRHSGGKGQQGVSEDGVLADKAGLQICMEKVVGESNIQRICIEHVLYARHCCQDWGHRIEQNRQKSHPFGAHILGEEYLQITK